MILRRLAVATETGNDQVDLARTDVDVALGEGHLDLPSQLATGNRHRYHTHVVTISFGCLMASPRPPIARLVLIAIPLAAVVIGSLYALDQYQRRHRPVPIATRPATLPATRLVVATTQPKPPKDFIDLVRLQFPDLPTTRPLDINLDLSEAGHVLIDDPIFMDPSGTLWITRADGRTPEEVTENPAAVNFVNRPVAFAHWYRDLRSGQWKAALIVSSRRGDGFELIDENGPRILGVGSDYDWARGFSLQDGHLGAPTRDGLAIFTIPRKGMIGESRSPVLADKTARHAPVEYCFFQKSLIAWIPPAGEHPGSPGAVRWLDQSWLKLAGDDWPAGILQIIPMEDSVMLLVATNGNTGKLAVVSMEKADIAEEQLIRLIAELSDVDPQKRDKAYEQLSKYRATLWPIAERVMDAVPPEAQSRLKSLLKARITPLLGYCEPVGNQLEFVARYSTGGALFYSPKGVLVPQTDAPPVAVSPAWISALPGDAIRLLQGDFLKDLDPHKQTLRPTGTGTWIISDEVTGPRIHLGRSAWLNLMPKSERAYTDFIGVDRQSRYLFRRPGTTLPTLIIDPRLPDRRPRLPVWQQTFAAVGWSRKGYPAIQLEKNHLIFATGEWELMDEKTDTFFSDPKDIPPIATTRPSDLGPPLLADRDGTLYYDGKQKLLIVDKQGTRTEWPLPDRATGSADPYLVESEPGRFFLFNEPGRLLRLRRTPAGPDPFKLEATFSRNIPNVSKLTRMWVDPKGRIAMVWDEKNLAIAFPQGFIPMETRHLIPAEVLDQMSEDKE